MYVKVVNSDIRDAVKMSCRPVHVAQAVQLRELER